MLVPYFLTCTTWLGLNFRVIYYNWWMIVLYPGVSCQGFLWAVPIDNSCSFCLASCLFQFIAFFPNDNTLKFFLHINLYYNSNLNICSCYWSLFWKVWVSNQWDFRVKSSFVYLIKYELSWTGLIFWWHLSNWFSSNSHFIVLCFY